MYILLTNGFMYTALGCPGMRPYMASCLTTLCIVNNCSRIVSFISAWTQKHTSKHVKNVTVETSNLNDIWKGFKFYYFSNFQTHITDYIYTMRTGWFNVGDHRSAVYQHMPIILTNAWLLQESTYIRNCQLQISRVKEKCLHKTLI